MKNKKYFSIIIFIVIICLKSVSQDIDENEKVYSELDIIKNKIEISNNYDFLIKFDFSKQFEIQYNYKDEGFQKSKNNMLESESEQKFLTNSLLIIKSDGKNSAELIYKDSKTITNFKFDINKDEVKEMTDGPRTTINQGLLENGDFPSNKTLEFRNKLLFPILNKKLIFNKEDIITLDLPFNFYGSNLILKGIINLKCIGFAEINKKIYAKLIAKIIINDNNVPEELKNQINLNINGDGLYYYDIENNYFIFGNIILKTKIKSETKSPKSDSKNLNDKLKDKIIQEVTAEEKITYSIFDL